MKRRHLLICTLAAVGLASASWAGKAPRTGGLSVVVSGLRNTRGDLLVAVFASKVGFPDEPERAVQTRIVPLNRPDRTITFTGLPRGEYAVSLVHDENRNRRLDKNLLGIPREGFGTSNNVRPIIGPPAFADAAFRYAGGRRVVAVRLIYY